MKISPFRFLVILFLGVGFKIYAQDQAMWMDLELEKKLNQLTISVSQEYRSSQQFSQLRGLYTTLEVQYKVSSGIKAGLSYQYLYYNDLEEGIFNPRNRFNVFGEYEYKLGRFEVSLKERFQIMYKNTELHAYKINPSKKWRNKVSIQYDIPHSKITPKYSFETFYALNGALGSGWDGHRHKLDISYSLTSHLQAGIYGLWDQEANLDTLKVLGTSLKYKL